MLNDREKIGAMLCTNSLFRRQTFCCIVDKDHSQKSYQCKTALVFLMKQRKKTLTSKQLTISWFSRCLLPTKGCDLALHHSESIAMIQIDLSLVQALSLHPYCIARLAPLRVTIE